MTIKTDEMLQVVTGLEMVLVSGHHHHHHHHPWLVLVHGGSGVS